MRTVSVAIDGTTENWYENVRFEGWDLKMSVILALHKAFAADDKIHIAGPNLFGGGTTACVREAFAFLKPRLTQRDVRVIVAGYSRGAYAALRVAQGLGKAGIQVHLLALLDTVKCTDGATEEEIGVEILRYAEGENSVRVGPKSPADSKNWQQGYSETMASHEIRKKRAAQLSGEINLKDRFQASNNITHMFHARRDSSVNSRTVPMGHWDVSAPGGAKFNEGMFLCTHSCMGGMPFRGDLPNALVTRKREWFVCGKVVQFVEEQARAAGVLKTELDHPARGASATPPSWWLKASGIQSQYAEYVKKYGHDALGAT
jgi:pimeloyl-ACP methyl ester carboxylesterase